MDFVDRIISQTRYMVIVAVVASLALAATLFLFGVVAAARIIAGTVGALGDAKQTKAFAIASVEIADFFLIATALYIVGVGLYELFIRDLDLPAWLTISSIEELKQRLISVIVVALAVALLARVANWESGRAKHPTSRGPWWRSRHVLRERGQRCARRNRNDYVGYRQWCPCHER